MGHKIRCIVVGIGGRVLEDYLPAIIGHEGIELVGGVDRDPLVAVNLPSGVPFFTKLHEAIESSHPEMAIVATPHASHFEIVTELVRAGIPVLKEKPFAVNTKDASFLEKLVRQNDGFVRVAVQRHYSRVFEQGKIALDSLGSLRHFTADYHLRTPPYGDTWRGSLADAGGGALLDMGYHTIDLLTSYFGLPKKVSAVQVEGRDGTTSGEVEESITAVLQYHSGLTGQLFLSRCEPRKHESLWVVGTEGSMTVTPSGLARLDSSGNETSTLAQAEAWPKGVRDVLDAFIDSLGNPLVREEELRRGTAVTSLVAAAYRSMRDDGGWAEPSIELQQTASDSEPATTDLKEAM